MTLLAWFPIVFVNKQGCFLLEEEKKKKELWKKRKDCAAAQNPKCVFPKEKAGSNLQAFDSFPALIQLATPKSTLL